MADELRHTDCDCCEHAKSIIDRLRTQLALQDKALADVRHVINPWTRQGHILLHAGEMKAAELRAVKAVTGCIQRQVNEIIAGVLADTQALSPSMTDAK